MINAALKATGWLLARLPENAVAFLVRSVGWTFYTVVVSRRRLIHSNLHHAFPEKPPAWRDRIARECVRRFVETAFLSLANPFLSTDRIRRIVRSTPALDGFFAEHRATPFPTIIASPHFAHWEVQTAQFLLIPAPFPEYAAIYRPIDNPAVDAFIKSTRERFGIRLLSRREGFMESVRILKRKGIVGILFDQNAGNQGALGLLFNRVCSTTELPGLLATRCDATVYGICPRYLGFWRVELHQERIDHDGTTEGVTIALNRWIETLLANDENICASWLWGHQRWKNQDAPHVRLRLELRRNHLPAEMSARGLAALPRRTRLWIRMSNWLGDVVMAIPLLRAVRAARPDAEITLICKAQFHPLLADLGIADRLIALPKRGGGYFARFRALRLEYPDVYLLFTNSVRGDLEAWLTGCRQRFGIARRGKHRRPLLTHAYEPPPDFDETQNHQFELWTNFLRHFGLQSEPDRSPHAPQDRRPSADAPVGLICGSENNPEKRWPVAHWRKLIESLPQVRFVLLGTPADRAITDEVASGFGGRIENLAGRTDLRQFSDKLRECRLLVTNDTGGMHLANALGVPLIALFGPTNPVRTGPIFSAPATILQPPGCAPTGGGRLADLAVETVNEAVRKALGC